MTTDENSRIPIFIDCDTGIDDALALAYLLAEPNAHVVGIGTVFGNTSADQAAHNTLAILELAGATGIPVAVGARKPLEHDFNGGAPSIHGVDGLGGIGLHAVRTVPEAVPATALLARLAREWGGELRILALGPLTNLAEFLTDYPDCVPLIKDVIIMGGAFSRPGNASAVGEANIHNDPEAAAAVFAGQWSTAVLPLDITMRHLLSEQEAEDLGRIPGALPPQLEAMLHVYFDAYEGVLHTRNCALHDPLAAIVAAAGASVVSADEPEQIEVVVEGPDRGRTIALMGASEASTRHRIVREIDGRAAEVLLDTLRAHSWPLLPTTV